MFDDTITKKIDNFIKEKFDIIYEYDFDGLVLLWGGANRNILIGNEIKDLDFVILTQGKCQILNFINKFGLQYIYNACGGYKILYKGFSIDMCTVDDLLMAAIYDVDMFFYDIHLHSFIICGVNRAIATRTVTNINNDDENTLYSNKLRLKKIIKFIKRITNDDSEVLVKRQGLLWEFRLFKSRIIYIFRKILKK